MIVSDRIGSTICESRAANDALLVSLEHYHYAHDCKKNLLEPGILTEKDRDISHERNEPNNTANEVFLPVEVLLIGGIQAHIICSIRIPLCQQLESLFPASTSQQSATQTVNQDGY